MKRKNVIISALVLAIALTGCSGEEYKGGCRFQKECDRGLFWL